MVVLRRSAVRPTAKGEHRQLIDRIPGAEQGPGHPADGLISQRPTKVINAPASTAQHAVPEALPA